MKHLFIGLSVLAAVSISSAKSSKNLGKRTPAQHGNVGPAAAAANPASIECTYKLYLADDGSGTSETDFTIPLAVTQSGSEAAGNLQSEAQTVLGQGNSVKLEGAVAQFSKETNYSLFLSIIDVKTGIEAGYVGSLNLPSTSHRAQEMVRMTFTKDTGPTVEVKGKKIKPMMIDLSCAVVRKLTI